MSDGLPGHTCPAIDRCLRVVRRMRREGVGDPVELGALLVDLEQLREDNTRLREGYAAARRELDHHERRERVRRLTG